MSLLALDIETTGLDAFNDKILCIGVWSPKEAHCFASIDEFSEFHKREPREYITHGGSFDVNFLRRLGVDVSSSWIFDTHSMSTAIVPRPGKSEDSEGSLSLEALSKHYLQLDDYKLDRTNMSQYSWEELSKYNLEDCKRTYLLFEHLVANVLTERDLQFIDRWLLPVTKLVTKLEYNGVRVDQKGLRTYKALVDGERALVLMELQNMTEEARNEYRHIEVEELRFKYNQMFIKRAEKAKDLEKTKNRYAELLEEAIARIEPFNWNSPLQLTWLLKDYYKLNIFSNRAKKETTNEAMLKTLDHPVALKLQEYRELEKLSNTCIPALLDNLKPSGCVHGRYHIGGTRTGRLSSSKPNLQQIPSGPIRSYIKASPGYQLVTADYAQIEPRILAHLSQEPYLIEAFKANHDIYSAFAKLIFKIETPLSEFKTKHPNERHAGKTGGLSVIYGTGARKFAEMVLKETGLVIPEMKARKLINDFRFSMSNVQKYKNTLELKLANRKVQYNLLGRPFSIDNNDDLYMTSLNTMIQGSASDLVASAFSNLCREVEYIVPRMIIHDEVVFEIPVEHVTKVPELINKYMINDIEKLLALTVPLKMEYHIGECWSKP